MTLHTNYKLRQAIATIYAVVAIDFRGTYVGVRT